MACALTDLLFSGQPFILAVAVAADLALGDPVYPLHPVRLIGRSLAAFEAALRHVGLDGRAGGIVLFVLLAGVWVGGMCGATLLLARTAPWAAWLLEAFLVYSLLALGDLQRHVWRVERALGKDDIAAARRGVANLVGRDTDPMDAGACRRAGLESLSENLTDGFISPVLWYVVGGLPALVVFKVVSTMDSMVGYRTARYLQFGWCGARLDDVMNYVPARLTWMALALVAAVLPGCSGRKAWTVGLRQHALLPGPNSGWSEAAAAGGIERRLVGPIWSGGNLVTDLWLGDPADPPAGTRDDVVRGTLLVVVTGLVAAAGACVALHLFLAP